MIRARAGHARRGLDHVQAVHLATFAIDFGILIELAAAIKLFHIANVPRSAGQEIGIERKDDLGLLRTINRVGVAAEGKLGALARPVAAGRFPLMPLRLRVER